MSSPTFFQAAAVFIAVAAACIALIVKAASPAFGRARIVQLVLLGMLAAVVAMLVELLVIPAGLKQRLTHITLLAVIAGVVEEGVKTLVFSRAVRGRRGDLVAAALVFGMGVGLTENLIYATKLPSWLMLFARAFLSGQGHAVYTGLLALSWTRDPSRRVRGFVLAVAAHTLFDGAGLAPQLADHAIVAELFARATQLAIVAGSLWSIGRFLRADRCSVAAAPSTALHAPSPIAVPLGRLSSRAR